MHPHTHAHTCTHMLPHTCTPTHTHTHTHHIYTHTHTHTHHIYTHTHMHIHTIHPSTLTLLPLTPPSLKLHEFSLHHLGSLEAANLSPYSCVLEEETTPILASLCPVVFKSRRDGSHPRHGSSCEEEEEPMLAVAMEMRLDKLRNSKVRSNH